jgi:TonB family protein
MPESAEEIFQRARAQFDRRDYAQAAEGFQKVLRILRNSGASGSASELRTLAVDFETLSRVALAQRADSPIYTSADEGVTEPVPVRPYLPERVATGMAEGTSAVLELVVDSRGAVESVHLRSPNNHYRDRWWVSVAKNWQFRPALKDGQPVKFLKRVVISDATIGDPQ